MSRTAREFRRIDAQLAEMAGFDAPALAESAPSVSGWSVGQQIDHLSRVGVEIARGLSEVAATGNFPAYGTDAGMTLTGRILLRAGWIPRGVARAPRSVTPEADAGTEELRLRIHELRRTLALLWADPEALDRAPARRKHPYFGGLTASSWVRFLWVHQRHHLKIVRDIRRAVRRETALRRAPTTTE